MRFENKPTLGKFFPWDEILSVIRAVGWFTLLIQLYDQSYREIKGRSTGKFSWRGVAFQGSSEQMARDEKS